MEPSGYVRFVGGPWHNRHVPLTRWNPVIYVRLEVELKAAYTLEPPKPEPCDVVAYQLVRLRWGRGFFCEYHCSIPPFGRSCLNSGNDFMHEMPELAFIEFLGRLDATLLAWWIGLKRRIGENPEICYGTSASLSGPQANMLIIDDPENEPPAPDPQPRAPT